jgi:predicted DNA-binding transcriptional regulator AlpA
MESPLLPDSARHFDALPDSARIDIAAVIAVTGRSRATIYRWVDKGILPAPRKLGVGTQNLWTVGDLRRALNAK